MARKKIIIAAGTRPEAVKVAPVVHQLRERTDVVEAKLLATGQHRDLLDQMLADFNLAPDEDFNIMQQGQSLADITIRVLQAAGEYLVSEKPDLVLAQGDTTTVMALGLACFYERIPFGHIEAGLRTGDLQQPFPEEFNRHLADLTARYNFAPTPRAAANLVREGISEDTVFVTGNTVVDALQFILANTAPPPLPIPGGAPYLLLTCHRRELFGDPILEIFEAVKQLAHEFPEVFIWFPVHPNPQVLAPAERLLGGIPNILLSKPLGYTACIHAMQGAQFILSDSGGIQEEAPSLGKPVLVLRDKTERPEAVEAGTSRLVGPNHDRILSDSRELLSRGELYNQMSKASNPFGDGLAAKRICSILLGEPFKPCA